MIDLDNISVEFTTATNKVLALKDVSINIGAEVLGLIGPSGCGKTTLLRVIANLIKPTAGKVTFDGDNFSYGIVFQDYSLLPWLTAQQNIELGLKMRGELPQLIAEKSQRILYQIGLEEAAHMLPHQLSGGMRQRVAVGRAFATSPSILLMDEPFGALDTFTREELQRILNQLYSSEPHTVIFVTHDVEEALFLSDRICLMTKRPGTVRELIEVPFARPRKIKVKRDPSFVKMRYEIADRLRSTM